MQLLFANTDSTFGNTLAAATAPMAMAPLFKKLRRETDFGISNSFSGRVIFLRYLDIPGKF
jgi:hypothetical protein